MIPILALNPTRLGVIRTPEGIRFTKKHIGLPVVFDDFGMMVTWGSRVTYVEPSGDVDLDKASEGGIVCGAFTDNHRVKRNFLSTRVMSFDFDHDVDVDQVAAEVADLSAFAHETYKSKEGARRSRLYVELAEAVESAAIFDEAHGVMRKHFARVGLVADESAKDVSRLNYAPVRAIGTGYRFRHVDGAPLDVARMLSVQPPPPPRSAPRLAPLPERRDKYIAAAMEKARSNVATASEGGRHLAICRESWSLARLDLTENEIAAVLVDAFVAASGEHRRKEGERAVRDAVRARGAA